MVNGDACAFMCSTKIAYNKWRMADGGIRAGHPIPYAPFVCVHCACIICLFVTQPPYPLQNTFGLPRRACFTKIDISGVSLKRTGKTKNCFRANIFDQFIINFLFSGVPTPHPLPSQFPLFLPTLKTKCLLSHFWFVAKCLFTTFRSFLSRWYHSK